MPILVIHGTRDQLIPYSHGQQLYQEANHPKMLFPVIEAGHTDVLGKAKATYWVSIKKFASMAEKYQNGPTEMEGKIVYKHP